MCRAAGRAVDAWNEAAGRKLFEMSETYPAHGQKVMLTSFSDPLGECGLHGYGDKGKSVSVIYVNLMKVNRSRNSGGCFLLTTLLHELGHSLGLTHDRNPLSSSIMRVRPQWNQNKPSRRDIERLNAIRAGDGAD